MTKFGLTTTVAGSECWLFDDLVPRLYKDHPSLLRFPSEEAARDELEKMAKRVGRKWAKMYSVKPLPASN